MKYIRTYGDYESYKADYSDTSRGFRLKPTLYKYSEAGDHVQLELDDPRKHGDSTYMEITLDSDVEFSFYIGNKSGDTQTTMNCSIDWGDGTVETKTITEEIMAEDYNDNKGFKLSHNYKAGSYTIELYGVERDYSVVGDSANTKSLISHPSSVKRVVLGNSVVSIGRYAFRGCSSLTSVYIPNSVVSIEYWAFWRCYSLTSIHIPEGVVRIEAGILDNCPSLTSVYIPESVTSIGSGVFAYCTSLKSIHIPESVTSIGDRVFYTCESLTSINIPEKVTSIGSDMFGYCTSLKSIHIPESVTSIGDRAFYNCGSLTSVYIPEKVTSIKGEVFYNCSSLKSIDIPEKVTSIGDSAFESCSSLISISSFNLTTPTLGGNIFLNLPTNGTLHIKPGATGYDAWLSKLPEGWRIVEDL